MRLLTVIIFFITTSVTLKAQILDHTKLDTLPEGIYSTYTTYRSGVPTNNMALTKEYINRRAKRTKWMDACFLHYKDQSYTRVIVSGRFWYLEGRRATQNDYALLFGLVGAALSDHLEKDFRHPVGIIYDTEVGKFTLINTYKELEDFTTFHETGVSMNYSEGDITTHEVRLYVEVANQVHRSSSD